MKLYDYESYISINNVQNSVCFIKFLQSYKILNQYYEYDIVELFSKSY